MKIERTKNATRNITYGIMYRIIITVCPFIMRTILLYTLGVEFVGLSSLFSSVLSFLSLAELGVGNAMVYAMYKPIAQEDDDTICALLKLYRNLYIYIGTVILLAGFLLMPFLDKLIKGDCPPEINIYLLYLIYLANTVISYYFFGYKRSILTAYQREDLISKVSLVLQILMYGTQATLLCLYKNYYVYIIVLPVATFITNYANSKLVDKMYPEYKCKGDVSYDDKVGIKKNVKALIGQKISGVVLHSSDSIIISAFLGLAAVAVYSNYYMIISAVTGFTGIIYSSMTAGLGNSIATEKEEKNYSDFQLLSFMNVWLVSWFSTCILCLIQPFMLAWVGEKFSYPILMAIFFTLYFYIYQINQIVLTYKDAAGIWWEDRFRPYVTMLINLISNIVLVQVIGIYGIIISTIISLMVAVPWSVIVLYRGYFRSYSLKGYFSFFLKHSVVAFFVCFITYIVCNNINIDSIYLELVIKLAVCLLLPNSLLMLFNARNRLLKESASELKQRLLKG